MDDRTKYLEFLRRITGASVDYEDLFVILLDIPFEWQMGPMTDKNRATDGLRLRSLFGMEIIPGVMIRECSILEMMIGFSMRIEQEIMGEPGEDRPERWFWIMLDNLDLGDMINVRVRMRRNYIYEVIEDLNSRRYGKHGEGSLFPLRFYDGDQRELPMWEQMSEYLNENF